MKPQDIVQQMTLQERVSYCTGEDFWHTKAVKRLGVKSIMMCDGPHGLRCQPADADIFGVHESLPATCFPAEVTLGASWDPALCEEVGRAIGKEAAAAGASVVLGPGCNVKRNPLCGRNFEYFSEDPLVSGRLAASMIRGIQENGVAACVKHFAVNNQEYKRQNGNSAVDERTLREIYLAPFERAVREGGARCVMSSYNRVNGLHVGDSSRLLTEILRGEWGFRGTVITDWGAMNDRVQAFRAGCDLNMPGGSRYMEKEVLRALRSGALSEEAVNASVESILTLVEGSEAIERTPVDTEAHHRLARRVAVEGAVLLENRGGILPLREEDAVLIGGMAEEMRYQGSGSSHINPTKLVSLRAAMPSLPYCPVGNAMGEVTEEELAAAEEAAARHAVAIVVIGLPERCECESFDRESLRLPSGMNQLVERVANANPNTVAVLFCGSVVELPWVDRVRGILYMGLPGQAGGEAAADLLTGRAVPSGRLTESWVTSYGSVPSRETFGQKNTEYREGVYVGYRYYCTAGLPVRYPFGYGLSYSSFAYESVEASDHRVTVTLRNTGDRRAAEVVQLYVSPPAGGIFRPRRELRDFARVELEAGERRTVSFAVEPRWFSLWSDGWRVPEGTYGLEIGASSEDIRLRGELEVRGEALEPSQWQATAGIPPSRERLREPTGSG